MYPIHMLRADVVVHIRTVRIRTLPFTALPRQVASHSGLLLRRMPPFVKLPDVAPQLPYSGPLTAPSMRWHALGSVAIMVAVVLLAFWAVR